MSSHIFGYGTARPCGPRSCDLERILRQTGAELFPDARWGGIFGDDCRFRVLPLLTRIGGSELSHHLRRGDVVLVRELFDAFHTFADLASTFGVFDRWEVRLVALDVDLADPVAVDRWGRSLHRLRASETIAVSRRFGRSIGVPSLGFRNIGRAGCRHPVPDKHELAAISEVARLRAQGLKWCEISRHMMYAGWRSKKTRREWSRTTVQRAAAAYSRLVERGLLPVLTTTNECP